MASPVAKPYIHHCIRFYKVNQWLRDNTPGVCDHREMGLRFLYGSTGFDSAQHGAARLGTKSDSHSVQKRTEKHSALKPHEPNIRQKYTFLQCFTDPEPNSDIYAFIKNHWYYWIKFSLFFSSSIVRTENWCLKLCEKNVKSKKLI